MKKLLSILLIAFAVLLPTPIFASSVKANEVTENSRDEAARMNEIRYQAYELHYEMKNQNNVTIESGNLGNLISSTPDFILDRYADNKNNHITIPYLHTLVIYPEGTTGFYMGKGQSYYVYCEFSDPSVQGYAAIELEAFGSTSPAWGEFFNGKFGAVKTAADSLYHRFRVINFNYSGQSIDLDRLNFIKYQ